MGQKSNDLHTANTMVTNDDIFIHVMKHGQSLRNISHRHQFAALDMTDLEFPGFPDIDKARSVCLQIRGKLIWIEAFGHSWFGWLQVSDIRFKKAFAYPFVMPNPGHQSGLLGRGFAGHGKQAAIDSQCIFQVLWDFL